MEGGEGGEGCLGVGVESVSQCSSTSRDLVGGRSASM